MRRTAGTVVDSSVLLDLFTADPRWLDWSVQRVSEATTRGALVVNAVVLAEVAPRFPRIEAMRAALPTAVVVEAVPVAASWLAGHAHAAYRRRGGARRAILADFLIAAHAAVTGRPLLTRDPARVAAHLPGADLIAP